MVQANLFQRLNKMMMLTKKLPVVLHLRYVWFVCVLSLFSLTVHAQIKLPLFFCDSMILQRDAKINIWGWASANEKVTIKFDGKTYKTKTADDGKWKLQLAPMKAGGPYTMELKGNNKIVLHDILIGDVWVCAGQSNMEH